MPLDAGQHEHFMTAFIILPMIVTAYVPGAGPPNGGLRGAHCYRGQCKLLEVGDCACGPGWAFGTTFVVDGKPYRCVDRGSAIGNKNVDLAFQDVASAKEWGRRWRSVEVWRPGAYEQYTRILERLEH